MKLILLRTALIFFVFFPHSSFAYLYLDKAEISRIIKKKTENKNFIFNPKASPTKAYIPPLEEVLPHYTPSIGQKVLDQDNELQSVDLRYRDTPIKQQWGGTCSAFALIAGIENLANNSIELSERHLWSMYRRYDCELALNTALEADSFITTEEYWPQTNRRPYGGYLDKTNAHTRLTKSTALLSDLNKSIAKLKDGKPLYLAITVTRDMMNCESIIGPYAETTHGGHALSIVGYQLDKSIPGGGYFIVKNSWGKECGDKGYQYLSFYQCLRNDMYCEIWSLDEAEI